MNIIHGVDYTTLSLERRLEEISTNCDDIQQSIANCETTQESIVAEIAEIKDMIKTLVNAVRLLGEVDRIKECRDELYKLALIVNGSAYNP